MLFTQELQKNCAESWPGFGTYPMQRRGIGMSAIATAIAITGITRASIEVDFVILSFDIFASVDRIKTSWQPRITREKERERERLNVATEQIPENLYPPPNQESIIK